MPSGETAVPTTTPRLPASPARSAPPLRPQPLTPSRAARERRRRPPPARGERKSLLPHLPARRWPLSPPPFAHFPLLPPIQPPTTLSGDPGRRQSYEVKRNTLRETEQERYLITYCVCNMPI
ncbi:uncharacterized protein ACIBXB_005946 [Morphnus guianensis]